MRILYVTSEANPFAASGGLGDVMGALPIAMAKRDPSAVVEVILPLYGSVKKEHRDSLVKEMDICFDYSWRKTGASIYSTTRGGVKYYFVENHYYFDRQGLYGEMDDGERFAFFSFSPPSAVSTTPLVSRSNRCTARKTKGRPR